MHALADAMALTPSTTVLDIGGTAGNWSLLDLRPRVTLLNLVAGDVHADGTKLPFRDDSFDIAASQFGVMLFPDLPRGLRDTDVDITQRRLVRTVQREGDHVRGTFVRQVPLI